MEATRQTLEQALSNLKSEQCSLSSAWDNYHHESDLLSHLTIQLASDRHHLEL